MTTEVATAPTIENWAKEAGSVVIPVLMLKLLPEPKKSISTKD